MKPGAVTRKWIASRVFAKAKQLATRFRHDVPPMVTALGDGIVDRLFLLEQRIEKLEKERADERARTET